MLVHQLHAVDVDLCEASLGGAQRDASQEEFAVLGEKSDCVGQVLQGSVRVG